jgi:hypothetical protein
MTAGGAHPPAPSQPAWLVSVVPVQLGPAPQLVLVTGKEQYP